MEYLIKFPITEYPLILGHGPSMKERSKESNLPATEAAIPFSLAHIFPSYHYYTINHLKSISQYKITALLN